MLVSVKVMVFLVIEGKDKLLMYLVMFCLRDVVLFDKIDLVFFLDVDVDVYIVYVCEVNVVVMILLISMCIGVGMGFWL